jgi:hypothetical protein
MRIRPRLLPAGWYPGSASACIAEINSFLADVRPLPSPARIFGGLVPHAGWYFSGKLAAQVFYHASLAAQPDVVCLFGGHLGGNSPPLLVGDDAWETPLGEVALATRFYGPLRGLMHLAEERPGDNTIEVNLPFIKHFFPQAQLLAIRSPQSETALKLGEAVVRVAQDLKKTLLCFGSADLTHYGPNYGWAPQGFGPRAVTWVKEVNDKRFLDAVLKMDALAAIAAANQDQSSCSAGAPAAAIAAARKLGATQARLVGYYTSYDVMPGDSFVGYAGVVFHDR